MVLFTCWLASVSRRALRYSVGGSRSPREAVTEPGVVAHRLAAMFGGGALNVDALVPFW